MFWWAISPRGMGLLRAEFPERRGAERLYDLLVLDDPQAAHLSDAGRDFIRRKLALDAGKQIVTLAHIKLS